MSYPIDVEKELLGHLAAAHLDTGNSLRIRHRMLKKHLDVCRSDLVYVVTETDDGSPEDFVRVTYNNARDALERALTVYKHWKVPLGDWEFANEAGTVAVTWRHLRVRLPTLRWVLNGDKTPITNIFEETLES